MKKVISLVLALAMIACVAAGCKPTVQNLTGTMEELVGKIIEQNPVEFMGMAMALDMTEANTELADQITFYTGLENANDVSDVAVYEPMMSSIAFSLVTVRVNEGVDAKSVGQAMKDGIDTRRWLCVEADDLMVVGYGDVVMLIMVDSKNGMSAQSFVDAFKNICGADLSFTI